MGIRLFSWVKLKKSFGKLTAYLSNPRHSFARKIAYFLLTIPFIVVLELALQKASTELYRLKEINFEDVDFTDISYQLNHENRKDTVKPAVVLLNIGAIELSRLRPEMITIMDTLLKFNPKKIGIDIRFNHAKDTVIDNRLIKKFKKGKSKIVLAKHFGDDIFGNRALAKQLTIGSANLNEKSGSTIRTYPNCVILQKNTGKPSDKDTLVSFARLLTDQELQPGEEPVFFLKYTSSERGFYSFLHPQPTTTDAVDFPAIDAADLMTADATIQKRLKELIQDKIVIIGWINKGPVDIESFDIRDSFKVPNNPDLISRERTMPGMAVHANAVQMLLDYHKDKGRHFYNIEHHTLEIILYALLFCVFLIIEWLHHLKNFIIKQYVEIGLIVVFVLLVIWASVGLMAWNIHINVALLFILIPLLIEFKEFIQELKKWLDKKGLIKNKHHE